MSAAVPPVGNAPITAGYGPYPSNPGKMHHGIDFGVPDGTPVHANRAGTVTFAGWDTTGFGWCVKVRTGNLVCVYGHNSVLKVRVGQGVRAGDVLSLSGHSGNATGPHVHFQVEVNGQIVNPGPYVSGDAGVSGIGGVGGAQAIGTYAGALLGGAFGGGFGATTGASAGGAIGAAGDAAGAAATGALSGLDAVGAFMGKLGDRGTWVRVLQVLGGAGLIVGGVVIVGRSVIGDVAITAIPGGPALAAMTGK